MPHGPSRPRTEHAEEKEEAGGLHHHGHGAGGGALCLGFVIQLMLDVVSRALQGGRRAHAGCHSEQKYSPVPEQVDEEVGEVYAFRPEGSTSHKCSGPTARELEPLGSGPLARTVSQCPSQSCKVHLVATWIRTIVISDTPSTVTADPPSGPFRDPDSKQGPRYVAT
jgi:hypothetical protein